MLTLEDYVTSSPPGQARTPELTHIIHYELTLLDILDTKRFYTVVPEKEQEITNWIEKYCIKYD